MALDLTEMFGCNVFNDSAMQKYLSADVYESIIRTKNEGYTLDPKIAQAVAEGMKKWAVEHGATHYTHWFQPMNNITAGKHDSFITPKKNGKIEIEFSGKELIMGEPDASSFPSGGLRATFEARGYTAWDPTSPAFVRNGSLYIPTAFCSYTGEALDCKTPLLRSMEAVSKQAIRLLRLLGNTTSKRVTCDVGAEQEYFLIDRSLYEKRLDLKICGRTLFGAKPPKGQELDDHYCGRIRLRVSEFMKKLDEELWKLGVASKTKHNEVAPAQHELAPVFSGANIACDHNQLTMEVMRIQAKKLGLVCLLHEKPFANVNGSGKHNNWSLTTDDGIKLLKPGKNVNENFQFLLFLCAVIRSVDLYQDLIRLSAASAGNDHRLGANEAPPAIISIFLGKQLTDILFEIANGEASHDTIREILVTGVNTLPQLKKDDCDRNRTSPFAFTGNKFEFRMLGSSASIATANFVLNTSMAESLEYFAERLENAQNKDDEIKNIITETVNKHGRIIFNGNNYTDEWVAEAKNRGLLNLGNSVDAINTICDEKNSSLFEKYGVLSRSEIRARHEILLENYSKIVSIEAATMLEMANREIIPACIKYTGDIATHTNAIRAADCNNFAASELLNNLTRHLDTISKRIDALSSITAKISLFSFEEDKAEYCRDEVIPAMSSLREACDSIESIVAKEYWPMPSYTDLLHRV